MFKNLSIRHRLYAGFGIIIAVLLGLLLRTYINFESLTQANEWDRHTLQVMLEQKEIETAALEVQVGYRGYLLTGSDRFLGHFDDNINKLQQHIQQAISLTADNPSQQERLRKLQSTVNTWIDTVARPLVAKRRDAGKTPGIADQLARDPLLIDGQTYLAEMRNLLAATDTEERKLLNERAAFAASVRSTMWTLLLAGGAACVLLALLTAVLLARSILQPLASLTGAVTQIAGGNQSARAEVHGRDELGQVAAQFNHMAQSLQESLQREQQQGSQLRSKVDALLVVVTKAAAGDLTGKITVTGNDAIGQLGNGLATMFDNLRGLLNRVQKAGIQVTSSTTEIAASARQQEATGVEQAQTSVEVLSTTKEISSNTAQLVKAMEEVRRVAEYTTSATTGAQNNLRRMDHTMQHMVSASDSINAKLAALSEKASNINNVLTTITKVADQTNILSLNAAIEAEKAGEAGRGFSVVATEIRRLADQTSVATWDIEQMLKEMQSAVSTSVMGMDKFSEEIRHSVGEVRQVAEQLTNVIEQVQKLTPRFDLVLEGMQSQSVGAQQITETMTQLNEATQQTVDSLRATSEAVQQLQYAAQDLQASVSSFAVNM